MSEQEAYQGLRVFVGDLHAHTGVGYGYGAPEQAFENARAQLDFCSLTAHSSWPDMPQGEARLAALVDYHQRGFDRAARGWENLLELGEMYHQPGVFVTFPGFEWHSMQSGDHNVYYRQPPGEILYAASLENLRDQLRRLRAAGVETILVPHHIGYRLGYRGLDWSQFMEEFSPVVEILSMHGLAESDQAPYPYLHTMGPRHGDATMHAGLWQGKVFGVIGSTDHHSACPGSYGHGRVAVWAQELTRQGIWDAIRQRRCYAISGERIRLAFSVDNHPLGWRGASRAGDARLGTHRLKVDVSACSRIDYVEVLYKNRVIDHFAPADVQQVDWSQPVWTALELGWGEKNELVDWQVALQVEGGRLLQVEPRFRGREIVAPQENGEPHIPTSHILQSGEANLHLFTQTWGNPTSSTPSTQGIGLLIQGNPSASLKIVANDVPFSVNLGDLAQGGQSFYLGGFLTPAILCHKLASHSEYCLSRELEHQGESGGWYTARVIQKNGQGAWGSPVWI